MNSKINILLWLCCLFGGQMKAENFAVIKGRGGESGKEIQLMIAKNGVPVKYAGTTIASNGSFAFMFEPAEVSFYYLYDGKEYYRFYVTPNNEIQLKQTDKGWKYAGNDSFENQLLGEWQEMEYCLKSNKKGGVYAEYFFRFDSICCLVDDWLKKKELTNKSFVSQLRELVKLDLLYDFVSYIGKHQKYYESEEQQSAYYQKIIKSFPIKDESLLDQPYGIRLLQKYFEYKNSYVMRQKSYTLDERLLEIASPLVKAEFILAEIDTTNFERFCRYERKYFDKMQTEEQRYRLRHFSTRPLASLKPGDLAPNFIFQDTAGRFCAISDLQGKYKYIDFWATWCAPCKAEIPYLQQLESEYAGKNIEFISISIDKDREKWYKYVKEKELRGIQLWTDGGKDLPEELYIGSIPRFMLIDPDGNWVNAHASRPSSPALKELLNDLLQRNDK